MNDPRIFGSLAALFLALSIPGAFAAKPSADIQLEWDPVTDGRVVGYRIHYGNGSGRYQKSIDVGQRTSYVVTGLNANQTYYFAVTAVDGAGNESAYSNEVASRSSSASNLGAADSGGSGKVSGASGGSVNTPDSGASVAQSGLAGSSSARALAASALAAMDGGPIQQPAAEHQIAVGFGSHPNDGGWNLILNSDGTEQQRFQLDWPEYNTLSGETRLAAGDIDGDGKQEIVVGLGPVNDVPDMPRGAFQVLDDDYSLLAWGQVEWPEYNSLNGETRPAVGDLDGDGLAEIVIGLGSGGGGLVQVFKYADGKVVNAGWAQVDWPEYAQSNGETRVAIGDLDADGAGELVIGFGPGDGVGTAAGGNFLIKDEITGLSAGSAAEQPQQVLSSRDSFGSLTWADYATQIGETHPSTGDVDNDGVAEIVLGLGQGGNGTIEVFDFAPEGYVLPMTFASLAWPEYNAVSGETRPAVADLNGDGLAEVVTGLGQGGGGRLEVFGNLGSELWHQESLVVGEETYNAGNGETWPTVLTLTPAAGPGPR